MKKYIITLCLIAASVLGFAQSKVEGTVISAIDKSPVAGATVIVENTALGAITDGNGKYVLTNVPEGSSLEFSMIGFKTLVEPVNRRSQINVSLEVQSIDLDEVVVIGYGAVKKSDLTSSISTVKADEITQMSTGNAMSAIQGKVYLYQEKWSDASDVLYDVIDSKEYALLSDFGNVWSMHYNNSEEGIFEIQYMFDETYALGGYFSIISGNRDDGGWAWCLPTSDLENAYIAAGDTERLKYTIIKHGATEIAGEDNFEDLLASLSSSTTETYPGVYPITPSKHKSARVGRKYFIPYADRPTGYFTQNRIPLNHRLMRYADVLLMYAEAQYEQGYESAALTRVNEIRTRAKLSSLSVSGTALRDAIRLERRLELALEQNRLYDIRRWEESNGKKTIENLMGSTGTFVTYNLSDAACPYEADNQVESSDKGASFDVSRDLLFPIPLYEITSSGGTITQNPGWE